MAYIDLEMGKVDTSIIYVSSTELRKMSGVPRSTLSYHINNDLIDAFRFRNRTYFHPDAADEYVKLYKCGLLG
jgi:predicted transcriptional regulator